MRMTKIISPEDEFEWIILGTSIIRLVYDQPFLIYTNPYNSSLDTVAVTMVVAYEP